MNNKQKTKIINKNGIMAALLGVLLAVVALFGFMNPIAKSSAETADVLAFPEYYSVNATWENGTLSVVGASSGSLNLNFYYCVGRPEHFDVFKANSKYLSTHIPFSVATDKGYSYSNLIASIIKDVRGTDAVDFSNALVKGFTFALYGKLDTPGPAEYDPVARSEMFYVPSILTPPIKEGHTFVGWFLDEALTIPYNNEPITSDMTFYAKYAPIPCTITLNTNGGDPLTAITVDWGTVPSLPIPTKSGHTFKRWCLSNGGEYTASAIKGHISLVAEWQINVHTITFDSNGGALVADRQVNYGEVLGELPIPTREGYMFTHWQYVGDSHSPLPETVVTQNLSLIAQWSINQFSITLELDGGAYDGQTHFGVNYGDVVGELPILTRVGYIFKGWFVDTTKIEADYIITKDLIIKANWEIIRLNVTFMIGSEVYKTLVVDYGTILETVMHEDTALKFMNVLDEHGQIISKSMAIKEDTALSIEEMTTKETIAAFIGNNWWLLWTVGGIIVFLILVIIGLAFALKNK